MNEVIDYILSRHYGPDYLSDSIGILIFLGFPVYFWFRGIVVQGRVMPWFWLLNGVYCMVTSAVCFWYGGLISDQDVMIWHTINIIAGGFVVWWGRVQLRRIKDLEQHPVYLITKLEEKRRRHAR